LSSSLFWHVRSLLRLIANEGVFGSALFLTQYSRRFVVSPLFSVPYEAARAVGAIAISLDLATCSKRVRSFLPNFPFFLSLSMSVPPCAVFDESSSARIFSEARLNHKHWPPPCRPSLLRGPSLLPSPKKLFLFSRPAPIFSRILSFSEGDRTCRFPHLCCACSRGIPQNSWPPS